ncbi:hypothetical protein NW754_009104 [Fusarium falciforme]|nr:hypothetical protein NW754_009104 [Fusarium falciforme]
MVSPVEPLEMAPPVEAAVILLNSLGLGGFVPVLRPLYHYLTSLGINPLSLVALLVTIWSLWKTTTRYLMVTVEISSGDLVGAVQHLLTARGITGYNMVATLEQKSESQAQFGDEKPGELTTFSWWSTRTAASNLLENPFLAAKPADSENQSPSYNREEQNAFIEVGAFARRYLQEIRAARFKAKIDAVLESQEGDEHGKDGAPEIYDELKVTLQSVATLSEKAATDCLRQGRGAPSIQELREALKKAKSQAKKETEDVSIINKDEEERAGTTSNDFSLVPVEGDAAAHPTVEVQQQQERANLDSQNDQDEKKLVTGQGQLPRTLQTRKRQMSLLSPGQPSKRRSQETLSTAADDKTQ